MNKSIFDIDDENEYLLLKDNIDINEVDDLGNNALCKSSLSKSEWLIKHGININNQNKIGRSAIFFRSFSQYPLYIANGANINLRDFNGRNILETTDNNKKIKEMFNAGFVLYDGEDLSYLGFKQTRALITLLPLDKIKKIKLNYNLKNTNKQTLLFDIYDVDKVNFLINQGIDINAKDKQGNNALLMSNNTLEGSIAVKKFLVENGIDVNNINKANKSILHYEKNIEILKILLDKMNKNTKNIKCKNAGRTCLFSQNDEISEILILNGVDVNSRDKDGIPAFKETKSEKIHLLMLEQGLKINERDYTGKNLFFYNCINEKIIKEMIKLQGDLNALAKNGENALCHQNEDNRKVLLKEGISLDIFKDEKFMGKYPQEFQNLIRSEIISREKRELDSILSSNNQLKITKRI